MHTLDYPHPAFKRSYSDDLPNDWMAIVKSRIKSSTFSMPTLILTKSSGNSLADLTSAGIDACDILPGNDIKDVTDPKLTVILNNFVTVTMCLESSIFPVKKQITEPPPVA